MKATYSRCTVTFLPAIMGASIQLKTRMASIESLV